MKRALTLTGAILGLVGGAFLSIVYLITLIGVIELMSYGYEAVGALILTLILILVSVLALVFSAVCIAPWNKSAEDYKKKKGMIITAVVFNFISTLATLIMLIAGSSGWVVVVMILGMLLAIASAVLLLVDICTENGKIEKAGKQVATQPAVASAANDAKLASAETFEKKLAKLNAMKEHGIITEEEYTEIKKTYVKEFLG